MTKKNREEYRIEHDPAFKRVKVAKDTGAVLRDHIADLTEMRGYAAEDLTNAKREIRSIDREIEDARWMLAAWKRDPESVCAEEWEYAAASAGDAE